MELLIVTIFLTGCELGTGGSRGNLQFRDLTETVPPDVSGRLDQPVAAGGRLAIQVSLSSPANTDAVLSTASSSDPTILEVEGVTADRIVLHALAPGHAVLEAETRDGTIDTISLRVEEIAHTDILLLPWSPWFALPDSLWSSGAAILPGSPVEVFARHTSSSAEMLTGYGAASWQVSSGAVATVSPHSANDLATVRSGEALESFRVTTSTGGALDLETIDEAVVDRIGVFNQTDGSGPYFDGETMLVEADSSFLLHVVAYAADDRYVIGAGTDSFIVDVPPGDEAHLAVSMSPGVEDNAELDRVLANGRAFFVTTQQPGSAELALSWVGLDIVVGVQVIAALADSSGQ